MCLRCNGVRVVHSEEMVQKRDRDCGMREFTRIWAERILRVGAAGLHALWKSGESLAGRGFGEDAHAMSHLT
jgi:hypothetical protein